MYKGYGNITCDFCESSVSDKDFVVVKDKDGITHFCNNDCKDSIARPSLINERERNGRLLLLLNKLVGDKDLDSIELIRTWIATDTTAMKKTFQIVEESGNFNFKKE